jgi:ParB-like nuclease domain
MRKPRNDIPVPAAEADQLLKYELTPIDDLKPAPRNARKHTKGQIAALARSMAEFGIVGPIVVDREKRILAGHGRVEAAQKLGRKVVPTLQLDHLTPEQVRLYALADNAIAEQAVWDEPTLALELRDLRLEFPDTDLTVSGFAHPVIELAIAGLEQTDWSDLDN